MLEIVNLGRVRKRLARAREEEQAQRNRVRFGRSGEEKRASRRAEMARLERLEASRLSPDAPANEPNPSTG